MLPGTALQQGINLDKQARWPLTGQGLPGSERSPSRHPRVSLRMLRAPPWQRSEAASVLTHLQEKPRTSARGALCLFKVAAQLGDLWLSPIPGDISGWGFCPQGPRDKLALRGAPEAGPHRDTGRCKRQSWWRGRRAVVSKVLRETPCRVYVRVHLMTI